MLVDDAGQEKELVYDARKDIDHEDKPTNPQSIRSAAENNGRVVDLERAAHERPGVSGVGHQPDAVGPVAEPGHRGHAQSAGSRQKKDPLPPINQRLSRLIEKKLANPNKLEKRLQSLQKAASAG
jgi:hypothetical protein